MFKKAFSLLELSVVFISIGLLIGAVSVGTTILENARVQKFIADIKKFETAYVSFETIYNQVPGSFNQADVYFDIDCQKVGFTGNDCNGDGDFQIEPNLTTAQNGEESKAWLHVYSAGLVERAYTGWRTQEVDDGGTTLYFAKLDSDAPKALKSGQFMFGTGILTAGTPTDETIYTLNGAFMSARVGYEIDSKIDDGSAEFGKFTADNGRIWYPGYANSDVFTCRVGSEYNTEFGGSLYRDFSDPDHCIVTYYIDEDLIPTN